jgi:hypothetical protein
MKSLVTPLALTALVGSAAAAKTSSKYQEQLLPDSAPGSRLIQDPNVVIEEGRIVSCSNVRPQTGRDRRDNY